MHGQRWPVVGSLVSLVLLLLAASPPASPAAPKHAPFSLAILRRDGILLPFVTYDGHWKSPWPAAGQSPDMPLSVTNIPKEWWPDKKPILEWNLLPLGSGPASIRPVHAKSVNWYRAGCGQGVGLYTDYKPLILPPPPRVRPYPKDALAFSGDVQIDPIEIVNPKDPIVKSLTDELPADVTLKEDHAIELIATHAWKHSYTAEERKAVPISLEALYRVPKGREGRDFYYFEAVKRYFMPKKEVASEPRSCDLVTFVSGWFGLLPNGSMDDVNAKVTISSCDYAQASFMLPLGTVVIDDVRHWIVQWSNPSYESYSILKPTDEGMEQIFVSGGGQCPGPQQD
jgi:hypothetical protein